MYCSQYAMGRGMKIETGIPLPEKQRARTVHGRVAKQMNVGDSVLCERIEEAQALRYAMKNLKFRAAQRKVGDGWRVWRIE